MSSLPPDKPPPEVLQQRFSDFFGVSEQELIERGIDPDQYARENVGKALRDKSRWNVVLPRSNQLGMLWTQWGVRGYVAMFIGIALLFAAKIDAVRWIGIVGSISMVPVAVYCVFLSIRYRKQYIRACREEGTVPRWRRR